MTDSTGNEPPENTLVQWQAIQQDENDDWIGVGSIDPFSYFAENEQTGGVDATATFQMLDAAGLITVVATSEALTDTIYINAISTQPSYIEIVPPFPNEIMVQGGGGQESTEIQVAIRDGNGNYVTVPYWIRFNLVGFPEGTHTNGDDGLTGADIADDNIVDVLSQNGISTVSINSGTMPGAVQLNVQLFPNVDDEIYTTEGPLAEAEGTPVTVSTGPPAQGSINYSYVDIETIGGGLYQIPVSIALWDIHSNPVDDSTNLYLSVRGITDVYDNTAEYFDDDIIFWGVDANADSLIYKCSTGTNADIFNNMCQDPNGETGIPLLIENSPGNVLGTIWIEQDHPGDITPVVKTGNENNAGDSYPGKAWGYLYYSTSTIFDETFLQAQTYGANGEILIIDSRANHDGSSLLLPFTQDGTIGITANPGSGFLGLTPPAAETVDVVVTGSLTDYYQFAVDGGTLAINALGATIINVCDGIDSDGNGITGYCFEDTDGNGTWDNGEDQISINACSSCQNDGGTWISWDDDVSTTTNGTTCTNGGGIWYGNGLGSNGLEPWCGDGIADDDPVFGISNSDGQVVWTIRYFLGINTCDDCDGDNPTCEDFASTISLTLQDPQGGASDGIEVTLIQPVPLDMCP